MTEYIIRKLHFEFKHCKGRFGTNCIPSDFEITVESSNMLTSSVLCLLDDCIQIMAEGLDKSTLGCRRSGFDCQLPEPRGAIVSTFIGRMLHFWGLLSGGLPANPLSAGARLMGVSERVHDNVCHFSHHVLSLDVRVLIDDKEQVHQVAASAGTS